MALIAIVAAFAASGCGSAATSAPPPPQTLRIMTTSRGATSYWLADALGNTLRSSGSGIDLRVLESPGSVRNVEALQHGDAELGIAFADVAYLAFAGASGEVPFQRLRGIAVLQPNPLHLVVRRDSPIRTVGDLRGRRVGVGTAGSGSATTAVFLLEAFGLSAETVVLDATLLRDTPPLLASGRIDAILVTANYPYDAVAVAMQSGARLLPVEGGAVNRLREGYPFVHPVSIPAGTYEGQPAPIHTIGIDSVLVCRSDLDEEIVYQITRRFFEALPALAAARPSLRRIVHAQADATPIPLHEGAARYYRERALFP